MLRSAKELAREGFAVHWLHPKSKRPRGDEWASKPVATEEQLARTYRDGFNVGIRLGEPSVVCGYHAHVLDIDIRDPELEDEALDALAELLPNWEKFPAVKSGSGGPSIHVYLFSDSPFPSRKLAHSDDKITWTDKGGKTHKSWAWEIELYGTGKQVACPPSIHPETEKPYRWLREVDFAKLDLGVGPIVDDDVVESWGGGQREEGESRSSTRDEPSSRSTSKQKPLDLPIDEIRSYLADLDHDDYCFDYSGWLTVGMALHHEFQGDPEGLEEWHRFSQDAANYEAEALDSKWASFGKDKRRRNVTFASIINAGAHTRILRELAAADTAEDMDNETDEDNDDTKWMGQLSLTDKNKVAANLDNICLIFENDPRLRGLLCYNLLTEKRVIRREPGQKLAKSSRRQKNMRQLTGDLWEITPSDKVTGKPLEDAHLDAIRAMIEAPIKRGGYGVRVSDRDMTSALNNVAHRQRFHPVQEYLHKLDWDGEERLDRLFIDWLGTEDTDYHRQAARLFCIAAVARVFEPGHKFDTAPIIEGPQGIRKSTFIKLLARNWFVELDCGFDDPKRIVETLSGHWIAELPELSQFRKSEIATIKAFFTKTEEVVREAYGRQPKHFRRQTVYMGSTNDKEYLRDPTGGRRFWPIESTKTNDDPIDTDGFAEIVDQIWAEAFVVYRRMCRDHDPKALPLFLTGAAAHVEALELQESRRVETEVDAWAGMIRDWADSDVRRSELLGQSGFTDHDSNSDPLVKRETICALQAWVEAIGGDRRLYNQQTAARVSEAIRTLEEWQPVGRQRIHNYGQQRCFKRVARRRKLSDII